VPLSPLARSVTGSTASFLLRSCWLAAPAAPALLCAGEGNLAAQGTACPGSGGDLEASGALRGNRLSIQEVFSKYWCKWKAEAFHGFLRPSDLRTWIICPQRCNTSPVPSHQSSSAEASFCCLARTIWNVCVNSYIVVLTAIPIGTGKEKNCLKLSAPQGGKT